MRHTFRQKWSGLEANCAGPVVATKTTQGQIILERHKKGECVRLRLKSVSRKAEHDDDRI